MKDPYRFTPADMYVRKTVVGVNILFEYHRRILGPQVFGTIPKVFRDDAFSQGGYCIDAPDLLPAGSCQYQEFGPEPDDWMVEQTVVERGDA